MEENKTDSMFVTKVSQNFAHKLSAVLQNKEKMDSLLSNLENLKLSEGLDNSQYEDLKKEYLLKLDTISAEISAIKKSVGTKMVELEGDLQAYNKEHNDLNIRLKIGELAEQDCSKKLSKLQMKIEAASQEKSELRLLLDVNSTEDLENYIVISTDSQKNGVHSVIGKIQNKTEGIMPSNLNTDVRSTIQSKKKNLTSWIRRNR